ncbi:MAG: hypothetical protein ABJC09_00395 [Terriglobia bacterium]
MPLISDDYPNILQARAYGSRGISKEWYHAASLAPHIASTLLLYALAAQWEPMRKGAV